MDTFLKAFAGISAIICFVLAGHCIGMMITGGIHPGHVGGLVINLTIGEFFRRQYRKR